MTRRTGTTTGPVPASGGEEHPADGPAGLLDAAEFAAAVSAVTSAFGDPTRRDIYLWLRDQGGAATATDAAAAFGLHPNVARHHLDKLAAGGYLVAETGRAPGARSAGRPSKRYRVCEHDRRLTFPPRRDHLLGMLLARAIEELAPARAEALAEEVGVEYGLVLAGRIAGRDGRRSARAAVAAVADVLTAHGFAAHTEPRGRSLAIVSEHCPFGDAAQRYPHVVCALDRGLIRGLMLGLHGDTNPRFEASRPDGDARCVARV